MATISFTIPNNILDRVLDGFSYQHGYQDTIPDGGNNPIPNPQTKAQFSKEKIKGFVKESVIAYEAVQSAEAARQAAIEAGGNEVVIED